MKKKSAKLEKFIGELHDYTVKHPRFRKNIGQKSENEIHAEIWSIMLNFLERHFEREGYKDYVAKAHKSLYWEGQESQYGLEKASTFGSRNYPDFVMNQSVPCCHRVQAE